MALFGLKKRKDDNTPEWVQSILTTPVGIEDMVLLTKADVKGIVSNLEQRLKQDIIYTYIGHVLCVCNPYKWLPIYDDATMKFYVHKQRIDAPPHIFGVAEAAYRAMIQEEEKQCVIISGESGAGKTEASKQIQNYIAAISGTGGNPENQAAVEKVKRIFIQSNPLLEAFGNAKTLRNNNSSRFGKYFELKFDRFGAPQGGNVTNYLLEKSRIVRPGKGERNFHIFYQLLKGAPTKVRKAFHLEAGMDSFKQVTAGGCTSVSGVDDGKEFNLTLEAMKAVTLKGKEIESTLNLVALTLHLCNITFKPKTIGDAEGSSVDIASLSHVASLMSSSIEDQVKLSNLLAHAFTHRQLETKAAGGKVEKYEVPLNPSQACSSRDALMKAIYSRVFDLLVLRINKALVASSTVSSKADEGESIGVLDIYGFEIFDSNGFEQLCINYVNEKLQQIFIELTLKAEQEEYDDEGIKWTPIPFFNNKIVCDLIEAKGKGKTPGLLPILDDVCRTMHARGGGEGLDGKFVETLMQFHSSHAHLVSGGMSAFIIKHYAGDVRYTSAGFGDANREALRPELLLLCQREENKSALRSIFPVVEEDKSSTSSSVIRQQCSLLVGALTECTPHYVRCVKSNELKKPTTMDGQRAAHQVKYLGLPENIKVRRAGFAYRAEYHRFVERFRILSKETWPTTKAHIKTEKGATKLICTAAAQKLGPKLPKEEVQFGKRKIFIRTPETFFLLERLRERHVGGLVGCIQRCWRRFAMRKKFVKLASATAKLYAKHSKARRPGSIYRPYLGDYLQKDQSDERQALDSILENNADDNASVLFLSDVQRLAGTALPHSHYPTYGGTSPAGPDGKLEYRTQLLAVTSNAMYLLEKSLPSPGGVPRGGGGGGESELSDKKLPALALRRIIPLDSVEGLSLSKQADSFLVVNVRQPSEEVIPDRQHWVPDGKKSKCEVSGVEFGLMNRRHHCRVTGALCVDAACNVRLPLPDQGYDTPQRVADTALGFISVEPFEDIIICSDFKSELVAILTDLLEDAKYKKQSSSLKTFQVNFNDNIVLKRSESFPAYSLLIKNKINFKENSSSAATISDQYRSGLNHSFTSSNNTDVIEVLVPSGVPNSVVTERVARAEKRRKQREKRQKEERELEAKRKSKREADIEKERRKRLKEKKARKAKEKAKLQAEEDEKEVLKANRLKLRASKQSAAASPIQQAAQSELAMKLARRRGGDEN